MTHFELLDTLQSLFDEAFPAEDSQNMEVRKTALYMFRTLEEGYELVEWPRSQWYMEEEWFGEEAIPYEEMSYFIPIKRIVEDILD
jgi:hypothetical protein